ncbi:MULTISPECIES: DUF6653 family protein [Halorussus]|uniref:DUF6653 family protein n=1 Tax=Halorussus TaxID=1070314 RepID=UPI00209DD59F|nr:DUF6653 family protein [Halorussus vallis]USZ77639.1 hypothetical protein NGM07_09950 [Halorussus vallis]
MATTTLRRRFAESEFFWDRHANPASGWSRVPTGPLLVYALYRRNWALLGATVAFVLVNPVLFPAREADASGPDGAEEGWMTKGVRGEQLWLRGADAGLANWLNVLNVPVFAYALYAAVRRKPRAAAAATAAAMALKLAFVGRMARLYEREPGWTVGIADRPASEETR